VYGFKNVSLQMAHSNSSESSPGVNMFDEMAGSDGAGLHDEQDACSKITA